MKNALIAVNIRTDGRSAKNINICVVGKILWGKWENGTQPKTEQEGRGIKETTESMRKGTIELYA